MAKKIKFNLQVNGVGISSLEGLQDNFNIEDIMEHFKSGLLMRWLEVQGLDLKKYIQKMKYIFFIFSRILLRKLFITLHQKRKSLC